MVSLLRQNDFRRVQTLPFCYLCGRKFVAGDSPNRDHVPPQSIFAPADREPLWLPTHPACNSGYRLLDEKIGQLIILRYGKVPSNAAHRSSPSASWMQNFFSASVLRPNAPRR